jgi:hypothetical protein
MEMVKGNGLVNMRMLSLQVVDVVLNGDGSVTLREYKGERP